MNSYSMRTITMQHLTGSMKLTRKCILVELRYVSIHIQNLCFIFNSNNSLICFIWFIYSQMNVIEYCEVSAYGYKVYLAKEKPENIPKARALYSRLFVLDVAVKLFLSYWILKKVLSYFEITVY